MEFAYLGSINSYIKNGEMQKKWNMKKSTNNFAADGTMSIDEWIKKQTEKADSFSLNDDNTNKSDERLNDIHNKLYCGKKLTLDEEQYLQKKDPMAYRQLKASEAEQKSYEEELKRCRTKEEVSRVRMAHTSASLSVVNSVKNNPNIPEGQKLALVSGELQKIKALDKITEKFVKSGRYAKLPTDNEKLEAEKLLKEAEQNEIASSAEIDKDKTDNTEDAKVNTDSPDAEEKSAAEKILSNDEITRIDAENAPEVRKVKRAKYQYGDIDSRDTVNAPNLSPAPGTLNIEA